jgi:hypothetical protein
VIPFHEAGPDHQNVTHLDITAFPQGFEGEIVVNTIRFGVCAVVEEDTTTGNPMVSPMVNATSKIGV